MSMRDIYELMGILTDYQGKYLPDWLQGADDERVRQFLQEKGRGWILQGPRPDNREHGAGDYLLVWQDNEVKKLLISTFTPTNAGISINARLSSKVSKALADYLEAVGFTKEFV